MNRDDEMFKTRNEVKSLYLGLAMCQYMRSQPQTHVSFARDNAEAGEAIRRLDVVDASSLNHQRNRRTFPTLMRPPNEVAICWQLRASGDVGSDGGHNDGVGCVSALALLTVVYRWLEEGGFA